MHLRIPNYTIRILIVGALIVLLAIVRAFEDTLFYDPLLDYFRGEYQMSPLPLRDDFQLFLGLLFRYVLNSAISLAIIEVIFKDRGLTRFALMLYIAFFAILITAFYAVIYLPNQPNTLYLFYIRRFIIQPIFLLLFIPAFFYQKRQNAAL